MDRHFSAHKAITESNERAEGAQYAPRWVPVGAAILAVLAALASVLSNQRATTSLIAKDEAILASTHSADQYSFYEAKSIKEHIYAGLSLSAAPGSTRTQLQQTARHELHEKVPILARAREFEKQSEADEKRSERFLHSHETLEIGVTAFEVGVVLISISALMRGRALAVLAALAGIFGLVFFVLGAIAA